MQKIVVNKCYGGFGLSMKAQEEYLKLIGKKAYFYVMSKYKHRDGVEEHKKIEVGSEGGFFSNTLTKDFGETFEKFGDEHNDNFFLSMDIERDDPKLIEVIEKLGDEANGGCAQLAIVEIPDGVKWVIDDYDGMESVEEEHRSWY